MIQPQPTAPCVVTISGRTVEIVPGAEGKGSLEYRCMPEPSRYPLFTALVYPMCGSSYWAVRINEIGPRNRCPQNWERWFGGFVVGLGERLSQNEAEAIAAAWVAREEMPKARVTN